MVSDPSMDTVWTVIGIIAGAMYGAGVVAAASPANIRFAKVLFYGSAALLGVWCFAWELMTDLSTPIRVIVGLLIGAFVFVVVPETVRRMTSAEHATSAGASSGSENQMGNVSGNTGIVTQDQNGNNTISK